MRSLIYLARSRREMAHVGTFLGRKVNSTSSSSVHIDGGATTSAAGFGSNCGLRLRKLMRKLRKQSKKLCAATKPTTFRFHYDPLSYSRNFDGSGFGTEIDDDSFESFYYSFSSRFVDCTPSCRMPGSELVSSSNKLEI
ncbi:uncharacterized protein LOC122028129 [Zingiber officinale]|uniref:uncharacterized protein LOC122028129 n=1 Tax=Zingiber officinale TaxID=94328 RepID=UPI001C4CBCD8|nr:uncharacterized protein LOC122028129 [Zingiber officinale]